MLTRDARKGFWVEFQGKVVVWWGVGGTRLVMTNVNPNSPRSVAPTMVRTIGGDSMMVNCGCCFRFVRPCLRPNARYVSAKVGHRGTHTRRTFRLTRRKGAMYIVDSKSTKVCNVTPLICRVGHRHNDQIRVRMLPNVDTFRGTTSLLKTPVNRSFYIVSLSSLVAP